MCGLRAERCLQCLKVRHTASILHNNLAIENCSLAGQLSSASNDARVTFAPIMTIATVGASSAARDYQYGPVAVMLDLMNPVSALGRLVGQAGKLRRDKFKAGEAGHALF